METVLLFPYLLARNKDFTAFDGFITIAEEYYRICVEAETLQTAKIFVDWRLQYIVQKHMTLIKQRLEQSPDIKTFLSELKAVLETYVKPKPQISTVSLSTTYYRNLFTDIEELGWNRVAYINEDLTEIHLKAFDSGFREHKLELKFSSPNSLDLFEIRVDLPKPFKLSSEQNFCLKNVYQQFSNDLNLYQTFWDEMDEIDTKTWVLEPDKPMRKDTYRRIVISSCISVQITVDPLNVNAIPECNFLGSEQAISHLREKFNSNMDFWIVDNTLLRNLEELGLEFPSPEFTSKEDFSVPCAICYSYDLNNLIPDKTCDNTCCGQPFHSICLFEWLKSLPTNRQSFNVIFGECPLCSKPITCKMPTASIPFNMLLEDKMQ